MKKIILLTAVILVSFASHAQEFSIKKLEVAGEMINIYYDLIDTTANRTYTINIYSTKDSFTSPLTKVSGDLGLEVRAGLNRKIVWRAKEELGEYEGKIGFEIRGKVYIPFVKFTGFKDQIVRKRGVKFDMLWSGGRANSLLNFELYKDGKFVAAPRTNIAASLGKVEMVIPKNAKPGRNYQFKITDSRNKDDVVFTDAFRVKPKIPMALKIGILAVVGGAIYFVTSGEEPPPPDEGPKDIVSPSIPNK